MSNNNPQGKPQQGQGTGASGNRSEQHTQGGAQSHKGGAGGNDQMGGSRAPSHDAHAKDAHAKPQSHKKS